MAPEPKRSARDYEQALRRQELAAGRALVQAVGAEGSPGPRELAAARRVLTQALFDLRRLGRDLDQEIEGLRKRPGAAGTAPARSGGPGELDRLEAVRNAVEEVAERWEGRRDQLSAELERRQPRGSQDRRPGPAGGGRGAQPVGQPRRGAQPRRPRRSTDGDQVSGRSSAARARPERPRSPRSRRSPG